MTSLSNSSLNPVSIGCDLHVLNLDLNHSIESLVGKKGDMSDLNVLQLIYKASYFCQQNWIESRALLKNKINEILSKKTNPVEKDACFKKWKVSDLPVFEG